MKDYFSNRCSEEEFQSIIQNFNIEINEKKDFIDPDLNTNNKNTKDTTQYSFDGNNFFGKCKLPFEVVKAYIRQYPSITLSELKLIFPDGENMCGVKVFIENYNTADEKRVHGPIRLQSGESIGVSNQYNPIRISYFIKIAEKLGFNITSR